MAAFEYANTSATPSGNRRKRRERSHKGGLSTSRSPSTSDCFAWWRLKPAETLWNSAAFRTLDQAIAAVAVPANPIWLSARAGAACSAISLALRGAYAESAPPSYFMDVVMTMLLRCALAGDAAAILVFHHILRRLDRKGAKVVHLLPVRSWPPQPKRGRS